MYHIIGELEKCNPLLINDESFIRQVLIQAVGKARAKLLDLTSHKFEPQGVTAVAMLAESHISVHTWPEKGFVALDVFTCGQTDPSPAFCHIRDEFKAKGCRHQTIKRDGPD